MSLTKQQLKIVNKINKLYDSNSKDKKLLKAFEIMGDAKAYKELSKSQWIKLGELFN